MTTLTMGFRELERKLGIYSVLMLDEMPPKNCHQRGSRYVANDYETTRVAY